MTDKPLSERPVTADERTRRAQQRALLGDAFDDGRDAADDRLPWCPACKCLAVPDEDGHCGDCGTTVELRRERP